MKSILLVIILLCFSFPSYAGEYRWLGYSARALAMGNVGVSNARGTSALFYNPALLSNRRSLRATVMSVGQLNDAFLRVVNQLGASAIYYASSENIIDVIHNNLDSTPYFKGQAGAGFIWNFSPKGWAFGGGYYAEYLVDMNIEVNIIPNLNVFARQDDIAIGGFSFPISSYGSVVVGATGRYIKRHVAQFAYSLDNLIVDKDLVKQELLARTVDTTYAYDVGAIYRVPGKRFYTVLGVTWHSPLAFSKLVRIPGELSIGGSTSIPLKKGMIELAADYRDALQQAEYASTREVAGDGITVKDIADQAKNNGDNTISIMKRVHIGAELSLLPFDFLQSILAFRLGLNQGHITYGVGANLWHYLTVDATYYTEERGAYSQQKPDSRFLLGVSMSL